MPVTRLKQPVHTQAIAPTFQTVPKDQEDASYLHQESLANRIDTCLQRPKAAGWHFHGPERGLSPADWTSNLRSNQRQPRDALARRLDPTSEIRLHRVARSACQSQKAAVLA